MIGVERKKFLAEKKFFQRTSKKEKSALRTEFFMLHVNKALMFPFVREIAKVFYFEPIFPESVLLRVV